MDREARKAKANGSTRFCMGAAWRDLSGRKRGFERILEMVKGVRYVFPLLPSFPLPFFTPFNQNTR